MIPARPLTPAEMLEFVERWRAWMATEAQALLELACHTDLRGSRAWDEILARWGVEPLSEAERDRHARIGPPRSGGPPPVEVRRVAGALARYTKSQLDAFDREHRPPVEVDERLDRVRREADRLEEGMLRDYLGRVRPKTTTASIFANARASARHITDPAMPGLSTLSCRSCGAPRTLESTLRTCEFCGSTM